MFICLWNKDNGGFIDHTCAFLQITWVVVALPLALPPVCCLARQATRRVPRHSLAVLDQLQIYLIRCSCVSSDEAVLDQMQLQLQLYLIRCTQLQLYLSYVANSSAIAVLYQLKQFFISSNSNSSAIAVLYQLKLYLIIKGCSCSCT